MENWTDRTALLVGEEKLTTLKNAHVLIVGLGGVGSYAAENICRAGVGTMTIVDADNVHTTNLNRQLPALHSTMHMPKAEVMRDRLLDINPELNLTVINEYLRNERIRELLDMAHYDFIVDAIDTLAPKVFLTHNAIKRNIPIVCSMGAGGRIDPTKVTISDVDESYNDKLAFYFRKRLHRLGVRTGFPVVFSTEMPDENAMFLVDGEENQQSVRGTISFMPAIFGLFCASVVINSLTKKM